MLIGISGNRCSGKDSVIHYLYLQGFQILNICRFDGESIETNGKSTNGTVNGAVHGSVNGSVNGSIKSRNAQPDETEALKTMHFNSVEDLLTYITPRWNQQFVTIINDPLELECLAKRPFFLHVGLDAPLLLRYKRYRQKHSDKPLTLEQFVELSDSYVYSKSTNGISLIGKAQATIVNNTNSIELLYMALNKVNLTDNSRLRPTWDAYFMKLADLAAQRSNCMKRRVGCVIVRSHSVIATGYNGTPRGLKNCNEGGCARCNSGNGSGTALSTCLCLHAEENALMEAGRERINGNATLYCNTCPCITCSIKIVQSGIKNVVYSQSYSMDDQAHQVMTQGGITIRQYTPPPTGVLT